MSACGKDVQGEVTGEDSVCVCVVATTVFPVRLVIYVQY